MADRVTFSTARVTVNRDRLTGDITIAIRDDMTQRDYSYVVPEHLAWVFRDAVDDVLTSLPHYFPRSDTVRVP